MSDRPRPPGAEDLPPEMLQALDTIATRLRKRRNINLAGYFLAILALLLGLPLALAYMGWARPGEFRGWILLVPLGLTGGILWFFGRWAKKV